MVGGCGRGVRVVCVNVCVVVVVDVTGVLSGVSAVLQECL